jgi:hypothetical protein
MCRPDDHPPYPHPSHVTASGPGHTTGLDRTPADPPHPGCSVCHQSEHAHSEAPGVRYIDHAYTGTRHPGFPGTWHPYRPATARSGGTGAAGECQQCGYGPLAHRTDPTRDEDARINARRPRDDRNAPEE